MSRLLFVTALLCILGCGGAAPAPEGGGGADGGAAPSVATEPATILRSGTGGLLLRGVVLAPDGVLDPGEVLVVDRFITCVASSCQGEPGAANATWLDTHGVVSPGLIDTHNHLAYDFLPEWQPSPPRLFRNRYEWADDPSYEAHVLPYAKHRASATHFCPAAKWGELRALVHGTTTMQGQSFQQACLDWGIRNAEHYHGLGVNQLRTSIGNVRDLTDDDARGLLQSFDAASRPATRYVVHLGEGYEGSGVELEHASFAGRDPRPNRHQGTSLLYKETAVLIHAISLTDEELQEVARTGTKLVWSPSSNLALYGRTAPIARILELGITTGLGPDWTPSGADDLLEELKVARAYGEAQHLAALTPERLFRMVTGDGAKVVGLEQHLGRLEVGQRADLTVFARRGPDPFAALVESRAEDVRLVLIDGVGLYGDASLRETTAKNAYCEPFDACGTAKYLCVQEAPTAPDRKDETLADLRTQLVNILEGTGYPADEQYHRGAELLPLVDCRP